MSRQYKRSYELTILPKDGDAIVIDGLRTEFEITKSVLSYPNLCRLSIMNPNDETKSALQRKYTQIIFNAGYEGNLRLLFKGELRNVFSKEIGTERRINIYAGDGQRDWQNSIFNKTFSENVTIKSAVEDIVKSFKNLTVGELEGVPDVADKIRGQTLSGPSKDLLDMFAKEYGFNWSIQDGEIVSSPIENPLTDSQAVLISADTGMIGSPTVTEIGVEVNTLLNPEILPNRTIQIESSSADVNLGNLFFREAKRTSAEGLYKVQEVVFKGDSREGDWLSFVKGRSIDGQQ